MERRRSLSDAGWSSHPSYTSSSSYTIPASLKGRGMNCGFRDTWINEHMRDFAHVPGPGAFREAQEFVPPPAPSVTQSRANSVANSRAGSKSTTCTTASESPEDASAEAGKGLRRTFRRSASDMSITAGAQHAPPAPWEDAVDARRLFLTGSVAHSMAKTLRAASLPDIRQAPLSLQPSYLSTPGPGAYTQFVDFTRVPASCCCR